MTEYQVLLARIVRTLLDSYETAELEISVYDSVHDQQAKRYKDAMVSLSLLYTSPAPCWPAIICFADNFTNINIINIGR